MIQYYVSQKIPFDEPCVMLGALNGIFFNMCLECVTGYL